MSIVAFVLSPFVASLGGLSPLVVIILLFTDGPINARIKNYRILLAIGVLAPYGFSEMGQATTKMHTG